MDLCCFLAKDAAVREPAELVELLGHLIEQGPSSYRAAIIELRDMLIAPVLAASRDELLRQDAPARTNTDHQADNTSDTGGAHGHGLRHRFREPAGP